MSDDDNEFAELDLGNNEEEAAPEVVQEDVAVKDADYSYSSIVKTNEEDGDKVPLWLITFTDVMALMLTFFVLLYSMSVPEEEKWEEIANSFNTKFAISSDGDFNSGTQDTIVIDRIATSKALSLGYLKVIIYNMLKSNGIENVVIFQNEKQLIVSMPSELLFDSGHADINLKGKKMLFSLGGALSRVKNRIEIIGHTDPDPMSGGKYQNNWELSLARSASVASALKEVGYMREITIKGFSSARYDEMSTDATDEKRYNLSRRVDIVFMNESGFRLN